MRSRITIELDFDNNNEPYIQIHQLGSDDMRDNVLKSFLEKLGGESQWLKIRCQPPHPSVLSSEIGPKWKITAIKPENLVIEYREMQETVNPSKQQQQTETYVDPMTIRCGPQQENFHCKLDLDF